MVLHRRVGVRGGDISEGCVSCQSKGVEEHFEVHHVVDDDREISRIGSIPTSRTTNDWIETRCQHGRESIDSVNRRLIRWIYDELFNKRITDKPDIVSEAVARVEPY
jgi:hypothetical protein